MAAVCLTLSVFCFALLLGIALTTGLKRSPLTAPDVLLAPATGMALVMVLTVLFNRAGLPVNSFAPTLAMVLGLASVAAVVRYWRLSIAALRQCTVVFVVLFVGFLLIASPMLSFGLDWFSFSNADAVNYAMSAERLRTSGVLNPPSRATFLTDLEPPGVFYFLNGVTPSERYGVDELLAFEAATTSVDAFHSIMSLLIALHLAGIAALGALVYRGKYAATNAIVATSMLAASSLATFGIDYQLLGQAGGLLFLSALIARACAAIPAVRWRSFGIAEWFLPGLLFAALCEAYPELITFGLFPIAAFFVFHSKASWSLKAAYAAVAGASALIIMGGYFLNVIDVVQSRFKTATAAGTGNGLFPFYLVPSGISNLFGLTAVADFPTDPWMSLSIASGFILSCLAIVAVISRIRKGDPAGYLTAMYIVTFVVLFRNNSGFALYKLAMYMQPAVAAVFSAALVHLIIQTRSNIWRAALASLALVPFIIGLRTQQAYILASRAPENPTSANFIEIPNVSGSHLFNQLAHMRENLIIGDNVVSDSFNAELARIEGFFTRDHATIEYPTLDEWQISYIAPDKPTILIYDKKRYREGVKLSEDRRRRFSDHSFRSDSFVSTFQQDSQATGEGRRAPALWVHGAAESPFNRGRFGDAEIVSVPKETPNVLAFVSSSQGVPYFIGGVQTIYQLEPDTYFRNHTMDAIGRYLLLEVINPKKPLRVRFEFTETLRSDGENKLPPVAVIGKKRVMLPLVGRGAASVVSDVIEPQVINGRSYILVDMGIPAIQIVTHRPGLMKLWGKNVSLDRRMLTAFLRNLSAIAPGGDPKPSSSFSVFPRDLLFPQAVYSGIYEDGWASDNFSLDLDVRNEGIAHLRGVVPLIGDPSYSMDVACFVDGFLVNSQRVIVGQVDIPVMAGSGVHHIEWHFSRFQRLPGGDSRPVSLLIQSIR